MYRKPQGWAYAYVYQKRKSVVDVAGWHMWSHRRVRQFMADTADWGRRIFMALLLGQMLLSLLMEKYGWMGAVQKRISYVQIVGVALMMVGVVVLKI